ncbi:MAG: hypothetical protein NTV42_10445 [Chloroflexi bacterium]|nr:hypothetical protein [Chloroflexota bacterium]
MDLAKILKIVLDSLAVALPAIGAFILIKDQYPNTKISKPVAWAIGCIFWGFIVAMVNNNISTGDYLSVFIILGIAIIATIILIYGCCKAKEK